MLDLRRQMQESSSEQATLLSVQRQNRADILAMSEAKEAAEREAASLRQELILRKDELKAGLYYPCIFLCYGMAMYLTVCHDEDGIASGAIPATMVRLVQGSQENAMEISRELELQKTQLVRATNVASRAAAREAASLKEDGTVPFLMYKEEVRQLTATHISKSTSQMNEGSCFAWLSLWRRTQQTVSWLSIAGDVLKG